MKIWPRGFDFGGNTDNAENGTGGAVSFPKREARAFPLAPSAGTLSSSAPSQRPGIPQAYAIENLWN